MLTRTLILFFLLFSCVANAQGITDTIRLNFLYGSVPAKGYKCSEPKLFGGLKGGHVNIEAGGRVLDFRPKGNCPVFPENNKPNGGFFVSNSLYWDTSSTKWVSIKVPVTASQMQELQYLFDSYSARSPYDYAVFGMRCAAASYDVLTEIGIFKRLPDKQNIIRNFYPKLLRKRVLKWAADHHYPVIRHEGRASRKWETDEGVL